MDIIEYDSRLVEIVADYAKHMDRLIMKEQCSDAAVKYSVPFYEVLNDVDLLYQEEFGDIFE